MLAKAIMLRYTTNCCDMIAIITILRAVHKYKDSREQFEQRTHKRLIDIITPTPKTVDALQRLEMPAGVYIDIKMKNK